MHDPEPDQSETDARPAAPLDPFEELRHLSALVDDADSPLDYNMRLVALALATRRYLRAALAGRPAVRPACPLTDDDIDTIIDGLDTFCIGPVEDPDLSAIWQPYIDKLTTLKLALAAPAVPSVDDPVR